MAKYGGKPLPTRRTYTGRLISIETRGGAIDDTSPELILKIAPPEGQSKFQHAIDWDALTLPLWAAMSNGKQVYVTVKVAGAEKEDSGHE